MKAFINTLKIDFLIANRNFFFLIIIGVAFGYVLTVNFLVPKELGFQNGGKYFVDNTDIKKPTFYLKISGYSNLLINNEEELYERINSEKNSLGIVFDNNGGELVVQGYESDRMLNNMKASLYAFETSGMNVSENIQVEYLNDFNDKVPFNQKFIPMLMAFDILLISFMFIPVMVFQEKKEGSINAYKVTPAGSIHYMFSKIAVGIVLSAIFSYIFILFTMGANADYLKITFYTVISSIILSNIGLIIAQFYSSISEFVVPFFLVTLMFFLPAVKLFSPSFNFPGIELIPSYPLLIEMDKLVSGETTAFFDLNFWILILEAVVILIITFFLLKKRLLKNR